MSKNSRSRIRAREREQKALELRLAGASYTEIAKALDMTESGAYRCVDRAVLKLQEKISESAEKVLTLELERLDKMLIRIWPQVMNGDKAAIDRALKIMERRARYLGLDKPTSFHLDGEITHKHELTPEERLKRLQFLLEQRKNGHIGTGKEIEQLTAGSAEGD